MKVIIAVCICIFTFQYLAAQNNNATYIENSQGLCYGIYIDLEGLIANRTPTLDQLKFGSNINLPSTCLSNMNDELQKEINKYHSQDKSNIQYIINNYCSHMKGWVEYKPGTCQAGGPPPICPANHWYQNPSQAMDDYYNERNKICNERLKELKSKKIELMNKACNCWLSDLKENNFKPTNKKSTAYRNDNTKLYQTTAIKIPCFNGACPIGYECVNGFCREVEIQKNIKEEYNFTYDDQDKIADKIVDKTKDIAIEAVLDYTVKKFKDLVVLKSFYQIVKSNPASAVLSAFDYSMLGTFSTIYQNELIKAQSNANKIEILYEEQRRNKNNFNMKAANIEQLKNDIDKYKNELRKNIFNLNNSADGIEREKELGSCNCYNVLNYNNSLVAKALTELMNKPIN